MKKTNLVKQLMMLALMVGLYPLNCSAQQQIVFGYFSYSAIEKKMPEYEKTQKSLAALKEQFDAETARVEKDFNEKYEEFLDGQKEFPTVIRQKRQTELQDMMEKNIAFKREARRLYRKAEKEATESMRNKIKRVAAAIGQEKKLAFIINTDENACPWVNPQQGMNLNTEILNRVKVLSATELDIAR